MKSKNHGRVVIALILICLGGLFLAANIMGTNASQIIRTWWPAILVVLGILNLLKNLGALWGWFLIGAGAFFLARNLDIFDADVWGYLWPGLIVMAGLSMLFSPRRRHSDQTTPPPPLDQGADSGPGPLKATAVFSEQSRRMVSSSFQGGEATAVFGSLNVDLSGSTLPPGTTRLEVNAVFGSLTLRLPTGIRLSLESNSVLGDLHDRRSQTSPPDDAPLLKLEGNAIFGSIVILD
jgi:predicted membrane protein